MASDTKSENGVEQDSFGYSVEGSWRDLVEFGEKIVSAFEAHDVDQETISEWDSWRPRLGEEDRQMRNKTVEKAKVAEGEDRQELAEEAAEGLSKSREKTSEGDIGEAAEEMGETAKSAGKAVEGAGRDLMRVVEDKVYDRIARSGPMYFDSENFNASLEKVTKLKEKLGELVGRNTGDDEYRLTIKAESDAVEEALDEEFEEDAD